MRAQPHPVLAVPERRGLRERGVEHHGVADRDEERPALLERDRLPVVGLVIEDEEQRHDVRIVAAAEALVRQALGGGAVPVLPQRDDFDLLWGARPAIERALELAEERAVERHLERRHERVAEDQHARPARGLRERVLDVAPALRVDAAGRGAFVELAELDARHVAVPEQRILPDLDRTEPEEPQHAFGDQQRDQEPGGHREEIAEHPHHAPVTAQSDSESAPPGAGPSAVSAKRPGAR